MRNKTFYIVGNWKSNKTVSEASDWLKEFASLWQQKPLEVEKLEIILCPAFIHLTTLTELIIQFQLPLKLGVQTISSFDSGAYTGEVSAVMVADLVRYAIIGHSERRKHFRELEPYFSEKIKYLNQVGIKTIYCAQDETMQIPPGAELVGYEPVWAIGTGKAETPENADQVAAAIKQKTRVQVIYGGSVNAENVAGYVAAPNIDGVLPGGSSLKAQTFYDLIAKASQT